MKKLYLAVSFLAVYSIAFPQQSRLAAIGSSTTAGQGSNPNDSCWVRRVNYYYKYQYTMVDTTYKLGVNGYNCYNGMPSTYVPPPGRSGPDVANNVSKAVQYLSTLPIPANGVVIVNYPSNQYDTYTIAEIMTCLQTIYDSATRFGNRCYITTTQPRSDGNFGTSAIKKKMADIKDSIINRFGTAHTLNFWDGMFNPADTTILPQYSAGDNIHFNNTGHRILAERVIAKNIFAIAPLPIVLDTFWATLQNHQALLSWTIHCDQPQTSVIIQRSTDSVHFESLQAVPARVQSGAQVYTWLDQHSITGIIKYRLQITRPAGSFYSKIISVNNSTMAPGVNRIFPVPATKEINILFNATNTQRTLTCSIINTVGNRLLQFSRTMGAGQKLVSLSIATLPAGSYFVEVKSSGTGASLYQFVK